MVHLPATCWLSVLPVCLILDGKEASMWCNTHQRHRTSQQPELHAARACPALVRAQPTCVPFLHNPAAWISPVTCCSLLERARIEAAGGWVLQTMLDEAGQPAGPHRVYLRDSNIPGLAVSRCFGDYGG